MPPRHILRLMPLLALTVAFAHADTGQTADPASHYTVAATLTPTPASTDGRFRVDAELRVATSVKSADGRFRVDVATASCDPLDAGLFANGFESP